MKWPVDLAEEALKQLKAIPPDRRKRVLDDIRELEEDPFRGLVKPLKGKKFEGRNGRFPADTALSSYRYTRLERFRFCWFFSAMRRPIDRSGASAGHLCCGCTPA